MAVGVPVTLVPFARTVPAAMFAREMVALLPPTSAPAPPVIAMPVPTLSEEVATLYTPADPFETRRLEEASAVVVARPV
jgi:hypothetical protein